jgi:hypothetical protein
MTNVYALVAGAALCWCAAVFVPTGFWERLLARNYAGRLVSAALGLPVAIAAIGPGALNGLGLAIRGGSIGPTSWSLLMGGALVFGVGLMDDLRPQGPRGLRGHLRSLARGGVTIGVWKVLAGLGAGLMVAWSGVGRSWTEGLAGAVLMAAAANLWNGLDVAPARAAKAFFLAAVPLAIVQPTTIMMRTIGAMVPAGWLDLRERGMLGDGGANLIGFVVGSHLYLRLHGPALLAWAGVAVALNLLAETVTLSRVIQALRPIRWLDGFGRREHAQEQGKQIPGEHSSST